MDVKLVMFKPDGQRKDFPIVNNKTLIGRATECDLRVPLLSVSRKHCELTLDNNRVHAKDLNSSNGTYVNNTKVSEVTLGAGDRLVVGPVVFTLQIDGEPGEIEPVKTRGQLLAEKSGAGIEDAFDIEADLLEESGDLGGLSEFGEIEDFEVEEETPAEVAGGETSGDIDPLAALEALAGEDEEEEEKT